MGKRETERAKKLSERKRETDRETETTNSNLQCHCSSNDI